MKKCSKRKGIKGFFLRKNLLTKIKQCDVELSNVLQAFQVRAVFLLFRVNRITYFFVGRAVIRCPGHDDHCED
jgi:hypothetical protein